MTAGIVKSSSRPDRRQANRARVFALAAVVLLVGGPSPAAEESNAPWPWPVPVDPPQITATFMEARTGGYHTGLDIRTMGRTGLPVSTPLDGSVVRVRTSPEGYGKAVYLDVGDGRTLVFAHLSAFADPIQERIVARQAVTREYAQQIYLEPGEVTFDVGDVIALSGDTGTGAPHLHFEVRDGDVPINPIDFFDVPDIEPPIVEQIRFLEGPTYGSRGGAFFAADGDTVVVSSGFRAVQARITERTGINRFRLMPRLVVLRFDGKTEYSLDNARIAFDERWQRGLDVEFDADGQRWISLYRRPESRIVSDPRVAAEGNVYVGRAGQPRTRVEEVTVIALDHAGQRGQARVHLQWAAPAPREHFERVLHPRPPVPFEGDLWGASFEIAHDPRMENGYVVLSGDPRASGPGPWAEELATSRLQKSPDAERALEAHRAGAPWRFVGSAADFLSGPVRLVVSDDRGEESLELGRVVTTHTPFDYDDESALADAFDPVTGWPEWVGFVDGSVRVVRPTPDDFSTDTILWIDASATDAPERHDGLGPAFEVFAPGVAFKRGVEVSVDVPGAPSEYTLNARNRKGRWSPESGVGPDPDRKQAIRTRLIDTGIYRVVRDVTPPAVGPWRVHGDPVRDDVTLVAREDVRHGVIRPRWPALRLDVVDPIAGIDPEDVRVTVDGEPYPARPELEDDHVWIEWEVDPGPGTHEVRVEINDRLGNAASARITARLVE